MESRILLVDPKSPYNVGGALRACHIFGASMLAWTGQRVLDRADVSSRTAVSKGGFLTAAPTRKRSKKYRLPREERMKEYEDVAWFRIPDTQDSPMLAQLLRQEHETEGIVPVCVEVRDQAEPLPQFEHPPKALYIFGPEDGSVPAHLRSLCHRFLRVPSPNRTPLNLAVAVNIVLYDRWVKG